MLPIILCLFEGLNDLRLVYNDCEKIYFITFVKVGVAIYNDHTVPGFFFERLLKNSLEKELTKTVFGKNSQKQSKK